MLVVAQNDFQHIKFDIFLPQEKLLNISSCINDIIQAHSLDAQVRETKIVRLSETEVTEEQHLQSVLVDADRTFQVLSNIVL